MFNDDYPLDFAADYCGYSGLGDLLSDPVRRWGFLMDHRGLRLPMESGGERFDLLTVSDDFFEILEFLWYNTREWSYGFKTFDESYRFLISSPYFDAEPHLKDSRNHHHAKRASCREFVNWLRGNRYSACQPLHDPAPPVRAFGHFPGFAAT